jgi:hypothetical protein
MTQATKTPSDEGGAPERAQKELTASVGTPLVRQEKGRRRRLFGGRRNSPTAAEASRRQG